MTHCEAIIGFLVPRRSCKALPETQCGRCKAKICFDHARITSGGSCCLACSLPPELSEFKLEDDLGLSEADLLAFAAQYRQQNHMQDDWVDFT